ncbi:hypothetical protein BGAL_0642g00030 [Botrytis galanthina]|uniref:Aminoglycoside phosphotransferase domain-containing protein n=1 Tax=Botrytis galanthina TaxID=278940 RepID=A0A4S8QIW2_9HELO|nr:hypothetical protein BGAL_0642g00030 [Botrytis galanthina]
MGYVEHFKMLGLNVISPPSPKSTSWQNFNSLRSIIQILLYSRTCVALPWLVALRVMESDKSRALRIVRDAELVHPALPIVEAFLNDAVDGNRAARYLLETYAEDENDVDFTRFLRDWKDLVELFYAEHPHSQQLSWTLRKKIKRLYDMLGAFTTSSHQALLKDKTLESQTQNYWTLSKDAAIAFSRGMIRLGKLKETKYNIIFSDIGKAPAIQTPSRLFNWQCDLDDHSNSGIDSPHPELLEIHSRFSRALNWTDVARKIDSRPCIRRSRNKVNNSFKQFITDALLQIWSKFPESVRFSTYKVLKSAGFYLYGDNFGMGVQRLPFGMYLKYGPEVYADRHAAEFNALKVVRSQTSIPVPIPIDFLVSPTESLLVTSRVEGESAGLAIDECSDEEMHQMSQDLRSYVAELHTIEQSKDSKYSITNASGGPCLDYRIDSEVVGPFHNEKQFSESLQLGILPGLMHRTDHKMHFTHSDLNMRNILVKDGKISGIVDWENAGWYPEYWEYTKCHFGCRLDKRWLKMIDATFEYRYQEELEIERQYWNYHTGW